MEDLFPESFNLDIMIQSKISEANKIVFNLGIDPLTKVKNQIKQLAENSIKDIKINQLSELRDGFNLIENFVVKMKTNIGDLKELLSNCNKQRDMFRMLIIKKTNDFGLIEELLKEENSDYLVRKASYQRELKDAITNRHIDKIMKLTSKVKQLEDMITGLSDSSKAKKNSTSNNATKTSFISLLPIPENDRNRKSSTKNKLNISIENNLASENICFSTTFKNTISHNFKINSVFKRQSQDKCKESSNNVISKMKSRGSESNSSSCKPKHGSHLKKIEIKSELFKKRTSDVKPFVNNLTTTSKPKDTSASGKYNITTQNMNNKLEFLDSLVKDFQWDKDEFLFSDDFFVANTKHAHSIDFETNSYGEESHFNNSIASNENNTFKSNSIVGQEKKLSNKSTGSYTYKTQSHKANVKVDKNAAVKHPKSTLNKLFNTKSLMNKNTKFKK